MIKYGTVIELDECSEYLRDKGLIRVNELCRSMKWKRDKKKKRYEKHD